MGRIRDYLIGTAKEIDKQFSDRLSEHILGMTNAQTNNDYKQYEAAENEFVNAAAHEYQRFSNDTTITTILGVASIPLAVVLPVVGVPLVIDSACRVTHLFKKKNPIGLVGTVRELYHKKHSE